MSKEIRIGILAVLAIIVFILGFKFLKGRNLFSSDNLFYVEYANVDNLKPSAAVLVNGFQVGTVTEMYLNPNNNQSIIIQMEVSKDIKVPKDGVAQIVVSGLMSDRMINLAFAENCTSNCAESGDTLRGTAKGILGSILSTTDLEGYMNALGRGLGTLLDTLNSDLAKDGNKKGLTKIIQDLQSTMTNLSMTTDNFARISNKAEQPLNGILVKADHLLGTLDGKTTQISGILDNLNTLTAQLKTADLGNTMSKINGTVDQANSAMIGLKTTLGNAEKAIAELSSILKGIKSGQGTLGQLANNKELYDNLEKSTRNLNLLMQDLRLNPKRYVNVNVFGKKQKSYTLPDNDPADTTK
ncbi:MAG: MlaD family protein [Saprospiraceae bacterium]